MWRPAERIHFEPKLGHAPSAEEAARSRLFSPLNVGRLNLAQRTWVPAMVPWRATEEGEVTDAVVAWYERFAQGRPGAIVVEATGVRDVPSGPLLRIGHDRYIEGLKRVVDAVKRASGGETRLFIQIIDFLNIRRRPEPNKYFGRFLEITDAHRQAVEADDEKEVRARLAALGPAGWKGALAAREYEALMYGYRERVTDLDLPHVRDLPNALPTLFADAARRAEIAGFDGVELHYAHAYTMASFLSRTNTRTTIMAGESKTGCACRSRFFRRRAPRSEINSSSAAAISRKSASRAATKSEDTKQIGVAFARAGMDFLSTSRGGKFDDAMQPGINAAAYPYTGPSGYECMPQYISDARGPFGRNAGPTRAIREAIRAAGFETPVVCTGGVHNFELAEAWLADGVCDIVGAARQSLADPDWALKLKLGRGSELQDL